MTDRESAESIESAAIRWVWRLDEKGRTPELEAELEAWLAGDTRRVGAFLHAEATWAALDRAQALAHHSMARKHRSLVSRRALLVGGGCVCAAMAASIAGLALFGPAPQRYDTEIGEIRRVPLKDGSTTAINTQSLVEIEMTPELRLVKLQQGEAWFQVAKNNERPFIVEAGSIRVRAVGTAFAVRRRESGASVLVTEGVVETWSIGGEGRKVRVAAGERVFVADDAVIPERLADSAENDRDLAWRSGEIDLGGRTLAAAAAEFNRYNIRKLVIADERLFQERFHGIFRTDDPEGFANAVRGSLKVDVSFADPQEIRIGDGAT